MSKEHGERLTFDAAKEFLSLVGVSVEIVRELFGEGVQAEPGMLVIDFSAPNRTRRLGRVRWRGVNAH